MGTVVATGSLEPTALVSHTKCVRVLFGPKTKLDNTSARARLAQPPSKRSHNQDLISLVRRAASWCGARPI
jgi:hypothetical protein